MNFKHIIISAVLVLIAFITPHFTLGEFDIETILLVTPLLFVVLAGFFIANASANYLRMQSLISDENANLMALFDGARLIDSERAKDVATAIDKYMIAQLDYPLLEHFDFTQKEFFLITEKTNGLKPTTDLGNEIFGGLQNTKKELFVNNQELRLTASRGASISHWIILIVLAVLLGVQLLPLRTESAITSLIIGATLVVIYWVLVVLYELDSNLFLARHLGYKNPQQVFRAIGELPYYPENALKELKNLPPEFRVGKYKNYPHSFEKDIVIQNTRLRN